MIKPVAMLVAVALVPLSGGPHARASEWAGVELAWRNDPRPAADAPLPVEPPSRRMGRRAQRRIIRRGDVAPVVVPVPTPAAEPPVPIERAEHDTAAAGAEVGPLADASGTIVHADVAYGEHPRQRFDLHVPDGCQAGSLPVVAWIHGSDWRTGTKADCPVTWLVEEGFAVASIDYRPSDVAVFPAQLDDCRAAVATLRRDAETLGLDATRICLAGAGGGGHLAALTAYTPADAAPIREATLHEAAADADQPGEVAAVAIFDAPTHLPSLGGHHDRAGSAASRLVGGPLPEFREAAQRASPLVQVAAGAPPTLIVQGTRGDGTALDQGDRLDAALRQAGAESSLVILDAVAADLLPRQGSPAAHALLEFLDRSVGQSVVRIED